MSTAKHRKARDWTLAWLLLITAILWGGIGVAKALVPAAYQHPVIHHAKPERIAPPAKPVPVRAAAPAVVMHMIGRGETLWGIARRYCKDGNDWKKLASANGIKTWTIQPGGRIRIEC